MEILKKLFNKKNDETGYDDGQEQYFKEDFKPVKKVAPVTKAKEEGANAIICASTGNTSASAAAYGAKAGLKTYVLIPDGNLKYNKLFDSFVIATRSDE